MVGKYTLDNNNYFELKEDGNYLLHVQTGEVEKINENDQYQDPYLFTTDSSNNFEKYALMNSKPIADSFKYKWVK